MWLLSFKKEYFKGKGFASNKKMREKFVKERNGILIPNKLWKEIANLFLMIIFIEWNAI